MLSFKHLKQRTVALIGISAIAAVVLAVVVFWPHATQMAPEAHPLVTVLSSPESQNPSVASPYVALTAAAVRALPEAKFNAVIAGLIPYAKTTVPATTTDAYSLSADVALYGADKSTPVARFPKLNFMLLPTVVVPIETDGAWAMVLTPARKVLPSVSGGNAPAQTAAWIRRDALAAPVPLPTHVVISVGTQTLSIVSAAGTTTHTFPVGVGTQGTPTPTGVLGYIQARYLDPAQGQATYPIQLTSLHSAVADEPYSGTDGGLIGIHYEVTSRGAVSHGCVRLNAAAIAAVSALALGTIVLVSP